MMRKTAVTLVLYGLLFTQVIFSQDPPRQETWVRELRGHLASPQLAWDPTLARTAARYAQVLVNRGEISHRDFQGGTAADRAAAEGMPAGVVGEVLGAGKESQDVIKAWLASPPHEAILADKTWVKWAGARVVTPETSVFVVLFWKGP